MSDNACVLFELSVEIAGVFDELAVLFFVMFGPVANVIRPPSEFLRRVSELSCSLKGDQVPAFLRNFEVARLEVLHYGFSATKYRPQTGRDVPVKIPLVALKEEIALR